jgi:hypothetical protein
MVQALYQTLDRGGRKCLTVIYPKQEDGRRSAGGIGLLLANPYLPKYI